MYKTGDLFIVRVGLEPNNMLGYYETLKDFAPEELPFSLGSAEQTVKYLLDMGYIRKIVLDVWTFPS